jgi:hypothetical protein
LPGAGVTSRDHGLSLDPRRFISEINPIILEGMMSSGPKTSDPPSALAADEQVRLAGRSLAHLVDTMATEVRHFDFLSALSPSQLLERLRKPESFPPEHRESIHELREILLLTKISMSKMNEAQPGLPPDSVARTLDLISRPGASVVVLKGRDPTDRTRSLQVLGYGVVIHGRENFPDADDIPDYLMQGATSHRVIRLFVSEVARDQLPPGEAFSRIIEKIKEISPGGPVIGMVLTDVKPIGADGETRNRGQAWLEAKDALEKRGFENSQEPITEVIQGAGLPSVAITFQWYVWPPISEQGRELYRSHQERFRALEERQRERLAGVLPALPLAGGIVQYAGTAKDAFDIAFQFPGNVIYAQLFSASDRGANRIRRRLNLVQREEAAIHTTLPHRTADAVVINGVIPDVTSNASLASDRQKRLDDFLTEERKTLREGGFLVVRDTVRVPWDNDVVLRLEPHTTHSWSGGRTLPDIFCEFVTARGESHISEAEWGRVIARGEHEGKAEFLAPASIVNEFLAKYPYVTDWEKERLRPYAQHSAAERIADVCSDGLRLVYAGPEFSPYVHNAYRNGLIEIRDQEGRHRDLPPTNYIVIGQKVAPSEGVRFSVGPELPFSDRRFVQVNRYERFDPRSGSVVGYREVASRPNVTLDIIPYSVAHGRLYVRGRLYPRPLTVVHPNLDGSVNGGYLTEQLATIVEREKLETRLGTTETSIGFLAGKGLVDVAAVGEVGHTSRYFVRADTVDEEVVATAVLVPELPVEDQRVDEPKNSFGGRYLVRTFDAMRLLQGQQTGFSEDPRLERKIYELLYAHKLSAGPWLAETLTLRPQERIPLNLVSASQVMELPQRQVFRPAANQSCTFLTAHRREFSEVLAEPGTSGAHAILEYVEPHPSTGLSHESMAILPVASRVKPEGGSEILVGLEIKDLPAAQERFGSSALATVPTTRIPQGVDGLRGARAHVAERLRANFGIECSKLQTLGGKYVVSPGVTPEVVYPLIAEVDLAQSRTDSLVWVPLHELLPHISKLHCGQAITLLYRAAHMFGQFSEVVKSTEPRVVPKSDVFQGALVAGGSFDSD